jgi:hypothetical protein
MTHLTPMQGFCTETDGAIALFGATWLGIPTVAPGARISGRGDNESGSATTSPREDRGNGGSDKT